MAWPRRALACALLVYAAAAYPAPPVPIPADTLEGVKTAIRLKNFSQASATLERIAGSGDPEAQYLLGVFYLNGVTGPRNPTLARGWFEKSANAGQPASRVQSGDPAGLGRPARPAGLRALAQARA